METVFLDFHNIEFSTFYQHLEKITNKLANQSLYIEWHARMRESLQRTNNCLDYILREAFDDPNQNQSAVKADMKDIKQKITVLVIDYK